MKIISPVQPLIFSFSNADRLLEALSLTADIQKTAISFYKGRYFLTVYCPFTRRIPVLRALLEFGSFHGLGVVLDAFIAEHGQRIGEAKQLKKP